MKKRALMILLAMFALVAWTVPASAGTEIKDNPGGAYVIYYDTHESPTFGDWHDINVSFGNYGTCTAQAKWGNFPTQDFVQLGHVGGQNCRWGGMRLGYYYNGHVNYDPLNVEGSDRYCVASTSPYNVGWCRQLSDGTIFDVAGVNPAPIVTADFIICIGGYPNVIDLANEWMCHHYFWAINF